MNAYTFNLLLFIAACLPLGCDKTPPPPEKTPPFSGTIFLDPDIITDADPTTFQDLAYTGKASRRMFDRRIDGWLNTEPFLFKANYTDGLSIEIQVNPEFGTKEDAQKIAEKYAPIIGRLPTGLRRDVQTSWIHLGVNPFGGGNNNLLIHTGQSEFYEQDGILEETLVHEASHTSLDADYGSSDEWINAQETDNHFISTYARDNASREDIAESFLLYLALRHRPDRISEELKNTIQETIPNRIAYFDSINLNMHPIK